MRNLLPTLLLFLALGTPALQAQMKKGDVAETSQEVEVLKEQLEKLKQRRADLVQTIQAGVELEAMLDQRAAQTHVALQAELAVLESEGDNAERAERRADLEQDYLELKRELEKQRALRQEREADLRALEEETRTVEQQMVESLNQTISSPPLTVPAPAPFYKPMSIALTSSRPSPSYTVGQRVEATLQERSEKGKKYEEPQSHGPYRPSKLTTAELSITPPGMEKKVTSALQKIREEEARKREGKEIVGALGPVDRENITKSEEPKVDAILKTAPPVGNVSALGFRALREGRVPQFQPPGALRQGPAPQQTLGPQQPRGPRALGQGAAPQFQPPGALRQGPAPQQTLGVRAWGQGPTLQSQNLSPRELVDLWAALPNPYVRVHYQAGIEKLLSTFDALAQIGEIEEKVKDQPGRPWDILDLILDPSDLLFRLIFQAPGIDLTIAKADAAEVARLLKNLPRNLMKQLSTLEIHSVKINNIEEFLNALIPALPEPGTKLHGSLNCTSAETGKWSLLGWNEPQYRSVHQLAQDIRDLAPRLEAKGLSREVLMRFAAWSPFLEDLFPKAPLPASDLILILKEISALRDAWKHSFWKDAFGELKGQISIETVRQLWDLVDLLSRSDLPRFDIQVELPTEKIISLTPQGKTYLTLVMLAPQIQRLVEPVEKIFPKGKIVETFRKDVIYDFLKLTFPALADLLSSLSSAP